MDPGAPPVAPPEFQVYNSYAIDPQYARGFTAFWVSLVGVAVLISLPGLLRSIRRGRVYTGVGIWEDLHGQSYAPVSAEEKLPPRQLTNATRPIYDYVRSKGYLLAPGLNLDIAQITVVALYYGALLFCVLHKIDLKQYPNRAGFMSLAQLPVIFVFASKNGILSVLLGRGYEKLNFLHRWAGRGLLLSATIHGSLWIRNHLLEAPYLMKGLKEGQGMAAYGTLCLIVLTSLSPIRRAAYQVFFFLHVIGYVGFFIIICYHTPYAVPWIFPPIAFYAFDLLFRMIRFRIKDVTLVAADQQMTLIHVHDCDGGWTAGQHVRVRAFFGGRVFESHPLTICTAPPATSCAEGSRGLLLGARVQGPWTRALNALAQEQEKGVQISVMLDGPYGGCTIDLADYENVLFVAGGSGVTFTLGLLDDLVGRVVKHGRAKGERTRRVEFAWCIRSFGCIFWFAPLFLDIANKAKGSSIDVHFSIYVTCLCNPEAVPDIPGFDVTMDKPSMRSHMALFLNGSDKEAGNLAATGGGLGVAVCGPNDLIREGQNTIATLSPAQVKRLGGVSLHTEHFSL
ncbi:hypothetical protein EXIGLDRAFT_760198 [Exidia glandulosa HHB12029]|uniref:ferric-chelate reductase (NADPH) n=1 Tax=Exidia glandulosa HHB12029 TaxID=1314781 RepID=A0A165PCA0_EXIGL|nr:hypothetical protein EXIGLDRAFT_760198 [Exidia glandulosa HHB12029]